MGPRRRLLGRHPLKKRVLKNTAAEADQFRLRAAVAFACVLVAVIGLGFWYFRLQVWQHDDYAMRSEANRVKLRPVVPGRGLIYDRQGRILADNVPAFRIEVTPSEAGDSEDWLPQLAKVVALTPEDIARFEDERRASRGFKPIVLKMRVSDEEVAAFAVDRWRFPGVELVSYLNRRYPYGELFAHVIGYVGRIDTKDQEAMGRSVLTHTGKTGLERSYEEQLRGQIGYEQIETNVDGRPIRQVGHVPAKPGADLRLSIDLDLQRAMVTAFGDMDGSAVAVDPRTGEVLGMVSLPSYDSNLFVNGISNVDYETLNDDPSRPQFNRNVLGGGPPGSTMKPFMALAGLDSGFRRAEDKTLSTGEFHIAGQKRGYRDSHGGGHGWVDLRESIAQSVNTYYYKLALEMGIDRVDQYMTRYGFGQKTGIDLSGENIGILPSPAWKAKNNKKKEGWYPGETVIAGIGQGYWVVTALQLARGTAAIADGGNLRQLHLVREIRTGYESPWVPKVLQPTTRITDNPGHLQAVHEGMEATIHGGRGTATMMARGAPYRMAGKTGTAQKVSRKGNVSMNPHSLPFHLRHQALFVGYAPADNPTIAVAVVVEHGGYGGSTAAPIARKIFDAWLLGKMPEPIVPKDAPAPTVAPLAANGAAPKPSATSKLGEAAAQAEQDAPKGKPVAVNGAWAESVAQINARVASQPGHTPQVLQGPSMLRPALPGYVPSQTPSEAPRSDDALIEPDLDPEAGDDDIAPVTAPTTEPRR